MRAGAEQDARDRDRPEQLLERGLGRLGHARPGLRPEVLDDHLLDVAVTIGKLSDRDQRIDPLRPGLADSDQKARGEWDTLLPGELNRLETAGGKLVRRAEMRTAALGEPC